MNRNREIFGTYRPDTGWLHRLPVSVKGLGVLLLTLFLVLPIGRWAALFTGWGDDGRTPPPWVLPLGCVCLLVGLGWTGRITLADWWSTLRPVLPVLVLLAGYHVIVGTPQRGAAVLLTVVAAMFATRILLQSTPQTDLLDALVRLLRPLRWIGVDPQRVGLAVQIMLRAVPVLLGVVDDLRQAAAARGLRLGPVRTATPAAIAAVAYAHRTGEALAARGLD